MAPERYRGYDIYRLTTLIRGVESQIQQIQQTPFVNVGDPDLRAKRMRLKALLRQLARAIAQYVA